MFTFSLLSAPAPPSAVRAVDDLGHRPFSVFPHGSRASMGRVFPSPSCTGSRPVP